MTPNADYVTCPGGHAVVLTRWKSQCPECAYTFTTRMVADEVPPHYITWDGVTFGYTPLVDLPPNDGNATP